jgi:hypothetical protein
VAEASMLLNMLQPRSQSRLRLPPCAPATQPVAITNLLRSCDVRFESNI